jgi:DNA-binding NarL/FixJ family response regulator
VRIVIAEDQVLLRDGLVRLLESVGHAVVAQVGDARALVEEVNRHRPDLVIADVRMPPTYTDDGARAAVYLRDRFPRLAVLVLSQSVDPTLVADLARGRVTAFGYLLKDRVLDTAAFLADVATVGGGGTVIDPAVLDGRVELAALTEREVEVLGRVASGRSNAGIAADLVISKRTVEAHLRSIVDKLGLDAGPEDNQRVLAVLTWFAK